MKQALITFAFFAIYFSAIAQNSEQVDKLIQQGLTLHDKGEYAEAIKKYNAALDLDKENFDASYEKSFSLIALGKSKEAAVISKDLLKKFASHPNIDIVYIQYGSILDDLGKGKEAIEVYSEGITKFPNEYLLHFNKGLIYHKMEKFSDALACYENSLKLKPLNALANLYTGIIIHESNPIPALLAYSTFLAIEPATKRSKDGFDKIQNILNASVKKEKNSTSVFIDQSLILRM